jgi:hypothetical protein
MTRRSALPGADELFRSTGDSREPQDRLEAEPRPAAAPSLSVAARTEAPEPSGSSTVELAPVSLEDTDGLEEASNAVRTSARRRARAVAERRPSGRERHDEKITVYVSADELMDLEHARLALRGDHWPTSRPRARRASSCAGSGAAEVLRALAHPLSLLVLVGSFVVAVTLHGWVQALVARVFGDRRPSSERRTRPEPQRHLDPSRRAAGGSPSCPSRCPVRWSTSAPAWAPCSPSAPRTARSRAWPATCRTASCCSTGPTCPAEPAGCPS